MLSLLWHHYAPFQNKNTKSRDLPQGYSKTREKIRWNLTLLVWFQSSLPSPTPYATQHPLDSPHQKHWGIGTEPTVSSLSSPRPPVYLVVNFE